MEKIVASQEELLSTIVLCLVAVVIALIFESRRAEDYKGRFLLQRGLDDLAGVLKPEWLEHISMKALYSDFQFKILPFYERKFRNKKNGINAWSCADLGRHVQEMGVLSKKRRLYLAESLISGLKHADPAYLRKLVAFSGITEEGELGQAVITFFLFRGEDGLANFIANPTKSHLFVAEAKERVLAVLN